MLSAGQDSKASVEGVKFISGDEKLKAASDAVRSANYEQSFPSETPVKILRRGTLSCATASRCTLVLAVPAEVNSVD